jgi:hypothetical protein
MGHVLSGEIRDDANQHDWKANSFDQSEHEANDLLYRMSNGDGRLISAQTSPVLIDKS